MLMFDRHLLSFLFSNFKKEVVDKIVCSSASTVIRPFYDLQSLTSGRKGLCIETIDDFQNRTKLPSSFIDHSGERCLITLQSTFFLASLQLSTTNQSID